MAVLGLHCYIDFSLAAEIRGYSLVAVHEVLTAVASLAVASLAVSKALWCSSFSSRGSRALEHRLTNCGAWAYLLRGIWDFPRPGIKTASLALADGLFATEPLGKPMLNY